MLKHSPMRSDKSLRRGALPGAALAVFLALPGAAVGDRVVLWGDAPTVEEVAGAARTIPYTLMTGINRRVAVRVVEAADG